jgi:type IV pilus secretin PilQ/predicted competence protein
MAGMKIRFAGISNFASIRTKEAHWGALLLLLAFTVPGVGYAQQKPDNTRGSQPQSNSLPLPKGSNPGEPAQETSVGTAEKAMIAGAITDLTAQSDDAKVTVTIATDRLLAPLHYKLENPARVVVDFPNTQNKVPFAQLPLQTSSIKKIRVQQLKAGPNPIARVVFELNEHTGTPKISANKESVRLVFFNSNSKSILPDAVQAGGNTATPKVQEPVVTEPSIEPTLKQAAAPATRNQATASELKPVFAKSEARGAVTRTEPKLHPAEAPLPTPLVAALTAAAVVPARAVFTADTKFSGQPLTLDLIDIPLVDFFRLMSDEGGINIVMDPEIKGHVSIKVVKVPWDQIFEAVLTNNSLDKQVEGTVVRIARKATLQDEAKQQESLKRATLLAADLETKIKRLNYAKATNLLKALEDQKTVRGTVVAEERTNSLILTDLPSSINKLVQLIEVLDVPQPQVEIEARIVSATRDFARDIGIQFGFVDGNLQRVTVGGPNTFGTIGGTRPSATPSSTYAAGNSTTGRGASETTASESAAVSTGASTNNKGNYNVNLAATKAFGGVGISIGNIFDTFLLDAAITAGESKGLAKLISQPKVTAQNNSSAIITQGLRFPVQIIANNTISVQFQNAALTLTVTPQITYEGNVVLDLKVENNTPDFGRQVNGIPSIRTSESTTRVLVTDGGTTVIGGILIDNESTQEDKVPGLGSLPIIGNLFRRSAVSRSTQEVLFFVTPRVIK